MRLPNPRQAIETVLRPNVSLRSWWTIGGAIAPGNIIEAWQPLGAVSYAASKIGLVHGLTLTDGTSGLNVGLNWNGSQGWIMVPSVTAFLVSTIVPTFPYANGSVFARFTALSAGGEGFLFGSNDSISGAQAWISIFPFASVDYDNGGADALITGLSPTVVGFAGAACYADNSLVSGMVPGTNALTETYYIGAINRNNAPFSVSGANLSIQAIAFYSVALTGVQAIDLIRAMLRL